MGRNKSGGRNNRKQGKKYTQTNSNNRKLRLSKEDDEMYARVIKNYGGGIAEIICNDKKTRLLHIRKRFRGRNRRDNQINPGTMVLAGLRSWEVRNDAKKERADILYVYSSNQMVELKKVSEINRFLFPEEEMCTDDVFEFAEVDTWEAKLNEKVLSELALKNANKEAQSTKEADVESLNLSDSEFEDI